MNNNKSKVAFVTGGGTGIGKVIAITFAKNGYNVAISYRGSIEGALEVKEEIEKLGQKCFMLKADLSKYTDIVNMFNEFKKVSDRLDVLVNNAGLTVTMPFLETTEEVFDSMCDVDFKGAFFCTQEASKIMVEKNIEGSIIMITSNNAFAHFANVSVYGSVKIAAGKLAEHAAIELAKYKIRVNTIAPGWTNTGAERLGKKEDSFYKVPLQKWAECDEVADAAVFLSSPSAKSITGATLVIDNGALLVSDKREKYGF